MAFYTIHPRDIQNICFQKRVRVVDIREPQEYRKYHYPGAVNIPYSDDDSWCCRFSKYRPLLLYCEYGSTSLLAARKLGKGGLYCDWRCKCNAGADKALDGQNHFSWKYFCN